MLQLPDGRVATWITESDAPTPDVLHPVDDRLKAAVARRRLAAGEVLLWTGDFHNAKQLLAAVRRRAKPPKPRGSLAERWHAHRRHRSEEAALLGRLVVLLESDGLPLRRAPDVAAAVAHAWGPTTTPRVLALTTLQGALGAFGWFTKGLTLPHLPGPLRPGYGVFAPTRHAYVDLVAQRDVTGRSVLDVGCGTGVLSFVLLGNGATEALGTDLDPRAVASATRNAEALGVAGFRAVEADLWPDDHRADLVVFNAPWMPTAPMTRLDRAVYDDGAATLLRWLDGLADHLTEGGEGVLLVSDLPERLGLRDDDWLPGAIAAAGLRVASRKEAAATHGRARDTRDPLHAARAAERIVAWTLRA
jgi:SAM-dependent methyltransferase